MIELVQQLAVLDELLSNWDGVLIRMGEADPQRDKVLAAVSLRLASAQAPEEIAMAIDDLLDIVDDTPAYSYVRELIARAQLGSAAVARTRGVQPVEVFQEDEVAMIGESSAMAGQSLGRKMEGGQERGQVTIYFATNRKPGKSAEEHFSGEHDASGFSCGIADVTIPVGVHQMGELEHRPWWQPLRDKNDPRRFVVLGRVDSMAHDQFLSHLALDTGPTGDLLVFIHGYNVTFEDAARRAAQFAYDLRSNGRVLLYSWPSLGSVAGYLADEERAFLSGSVFASFLSSLQDGPWNRVHVLAHSMGNRVMLYGLSGGNWPNGKLNRMVFVAADVYVETFRQLFPKLIGPERHFTSYASKRDRALLLSSLLHKAERVGIYKGEPFVFPGLETVDASKVDTGLLGHGYFAEKARVIDDIAELVDKGYAAEKRSLIYQPPAKPYWNFR